MTRDSASPPARPKRPDRRSTAPRDRTPVASPARRPRERLLGGIYAFTAYLLWGFLPLYFLALAPTGPWELVAWRIVLSLVFCAILLTVTRVAAARRASCGSRGSSASRRSRAP